MAQLFHRRFVHLGHVIPIDQVIEKRLEVIGAPIAVVDVVGMLPDVTAEDLLAAVYQPGPPPRRVAAQKAAVAWPEGNELVIGRRKPWWKARSVYSAGRTRPTIALKLAPSQ